MSFEDGWLLVAGILGTLLLAIVGQYATADIARRQRKADRRDDFQLQTLIELQSVVIERFRIAGHAHYQDHAHYRNTGEWKLEPLDEPMNLRENELNQLTHVLSARIDSATIRDAVDKHRIALGDVFTARSYEESCNGLDALLKAQEELNARIGERIREL